VFIGAARYAGDREDEVTFSAQVVNASDFLVYDVQLWHGDIHHPYDFGPVLPGENPDTEDGEFVSELDAILKVVLTFRDAAGVRWVRMPDGTLSEQNRDTAQQTVFAALGVRMPESVGHEDQTQPDSPSQ
jgi:hypothetical protein